MLVEEARGRCVMVAMPAEKWTETQALPVASNELTPLIDAVAYYQELAYEYPNTAFYRRMLEDVRNRLAEAEKNLARLKP